QKVSSPSSARAPRRTRRPEPRWSRSASCAPWSFLGRWWRWVAFADDGQVQGAVLIHNHLLDLGQDLLHGFGIEAVPGNLRRSVVLAGELREARRVASRFIGLLLLVGFRFLDQLPRFAARLGDHVIGVAFRLIDDADRVGAGAGDVAKRIGGF